jgi:hypothetical protein
MSVELHFIGLFSHVSAGGRDIVVVPVGPANPEHLFRIVVAVADVDTSATNALNDGVFAKSGERSYYDVTGRLQISGVKASTRKVDPAFVNFVPKLTEVSGHVVLRSDVLTQTGTALLKSFLDHPAGTLGVVKYFKEQAMFSPPAGSWTAPRCVAAVVRLTLATDGNPIMITNGTKKIVLSPATSLIAMWNEPKANSTFHGDFGSYYRSMFEDVATESLPASVNGTECREGQRVNSVECSNSQYP